MDTTVRLTDPDEPLFGVAQVAQKLGVERTTLGRMIRRGEFPRGRMIAGHLKWSQTDLAAYRLLADRWFPDPEVLKPEVLKSPRKKTKAKKSDAETEKIP